jgi:hypothetical protein
MKHKKDMRQKLAEMIYKNPSLGKKVSTLEKSMKEVSKILNDKK